VKDFGLKADFIEKAGKQRIREIQIKGFDIVCIHSIDKNGTEALSSIYTKVIT
jgi:aryl-alcohol dehydrogenase-like predicted oxidoreductase